MLLLALVMAIGTCFGIFNYWFQRDRYKRMTKEQISRLNKWNSPAAWMVYTILFFTGTLVIVSYYIYKLYTAIMNMR
ncbi:MAG: hypothetical protein QHH06_02645 [Clostridiales bacterium]|jgi:ABC-type Fe3+ transport system permease subunit|nr:hypothetical protein [Eubacteriales bacterium]MDH7565369.1 hypothetical protein [Clostridiales bacterium]